MTDKERLNLIDEIMWASDNADTTRLVSWVERHNFKWRCEQEKELLIDIMDWLNKKYPKDKVVQNTIIYEMEQKVRVLNDELLKIQRGENVKYFKFS